MRAKTILALIGLALSSVGSAETSPPAATPATLAPLTLENFAAQPFLDDPELSPDGRWVAAKSAVEGRQILAMIPLFDKSQKPTLLNLDPSKMAVDWWQWVNDDWLLVGVSANQDVEGETWRLSRVLAVQKGTAKVNFLGWKDAGQNAGDVIWVAKDGTPRILLGIQNSIFSNDLDFWPEVREFDVSTGKSKIVVRRRGTVGTYYADGSGTVRLGYGYNPDSRIATLLYRENGTSDFKILARANYKKDEEISFPSLFLPEPGKALTADDAEGFEAIYELDLKTLQRGKKIFGVPNYDVGGIVRNAQGDGIAGVSLIEDRARIHWVDPGLAETQADFDKAVGAGRAQIIGWDRTRNALLVLVGGPDQAGAYYYYNRSEGGSLRLIGHVDRVLKTRKLAPVKTIHYKTRDGLDLAAVLTLPSNREAKNLPLILLPHGGPQSRDSERWDWWVQYLAWKGYAVVQPNYRGSTGFGKALFEKGYGEWGLKMQDDLNDAVTHLAKEGVVNAKRVCIAGGSYGGYAAMRGAQRDGGLFRCAISYAGVSDLAALARFDRQSLFGREYSDDLKQKAPNFDAVSPLRAPEQFSTPILLMHGKLDLRVPVKQSRAMADKLKAAGKTYRYVEQPLADHFFSRAEDRLEFLKEMDAFLAKYNPPD
jgi:dipeptidyl aminopeptidase/acylaminoacyl peptidase